MIYCMDREHNEYIYIYIYTEFATHGNFENSVQERYRKMRIFVHSKHFMIITIEKKKKKLVLIMKWVN